MVVAVKLCASRTRHPSQRPRFGAIEIPLLNDEFQAAAQTRFGVKLTCLTSSTNLPDNPCASAIEKFVDAFGSSKLELELIQSHMAQKPVLRGEVGTSKNLWGQRVEARRQTTTRS